MGGVIGDGGAIAHDSEIVDDRSTGGTVPTDLVGCVTFRLLGGGVMAQRGHVTDLAGRR